MSNTENIKKATPKQKRSSAGLLFLLFRRSLYTILTALLLPCILIISVTQIPAFRQWALGFAQDAANAELDGHIEIGDVEFHWLDGIHIYNLRLFAANDTLASVSHISLGYDAAALFDKSLKIDFLTAESAKIKLLRGRDGEWNFNKFVRPKTDTTSSKPFDWPIYLRMLELRQSSLTVYDSATAEGRADALDFTHTDISNLQLRLSAGANIAEPAFNVRILDAGFTENRTRFSINSLKMYAVADSNGVKVRKLSFDTHKTSLVLNAQVDGNVFAGITDSSLANTHIAVSLAADSIATDDLRLFLPDMGVTGTYLLRLDANGTLSKIEVKELSIKSPFSNLEVQYAQVFNLYHSEKLHIIADIRESAINYDELRRVTPVLSLPVLDFLGNARLKTVKADIVSSDSLSFDFTATTKSGDANGHLTLFPTRDTLAYRLDATVKNLNLGNIAHNKDLSGTLNGRVNLQGRGVTLNELNSLARIELNGSRLGARNINSLLFAGSANNGGIITIDTLDIGIADSTSNDIILENNGKAAIHGVLDLRSFSRPIYDISAVCRMFPMHLAAGFSYPLTLDGDFRIAGAGFHPDSLDAVFEANFRGVHLRDRSLLNLPIYASVKPAANGNKRVLLASRLLDLELDGKFTFASLIRAVERQATTTVNFVAKKIETVMPHTVSSFKQLADEPINDTLRLRLQADVRDLSPITLYFKTGSIISSGWLRGGINIAGNDAEITLDTIAVSSLDVSSSAVRTISDTVLGSLRLKTSRPDSVTKVDFLKFNAVWDSSITFNGTKIIHPRVELRYENHGILYNIAGELGDVFRASLNGNAIDRDSALDFQVSNLETVYRGMTWRTFAPAKCTLSVAGLRIDTLAMARKNAETITIRGNFDGKIISDGQIGISNFPLSDIQTFPDIPADIKDVLRSLQGNIPSLTLVADGSISNPSLTLTADFRDISYNNVLIGNQTVALHHTDSTISGEIAITNPKFAADNKTLEIKVEQLPLSLAFVPISHRLSKSRPVIIYANAKRLPVATFGPFVPGVKKLQGLADAEIYVKGTPGTVNYGGLAKVYGASMTTLSTNISYSADGVFSLKNNAVTVDAFRLRNQPGDFRGGIANVTGRIILEGFSIDSLDLNITSPGIMLMNDASAATMPIMYGRFIASTPDTSIRFHGKLDKPYLHGGLSVTAADIVMPPDKKIQAGISRFRYVTDDSRKKILIEELPPDSTKVQTNVAKTKTDIESNSPNERKERISLSIIDKTDFDLTIKATHRMTLRMILAEFEEIRAEILPLDARKSLRYLYNPNDGKRQLYGDLTLSSNSEYQFLKVFGASGNLSFIDGEISNPTLNLDASYSGRLSGADNRPFKVMLKITGTKKIPHVAISYDIDGIEATGDSAKIRGDALTLLMTGRTQDQLFSKSAGGGFNAANELSTSLSAAASQLFSGLLEGTGFIQSASINFDGGVQDVSQARLNLSGQLFGDVAWRVGGTLNDISNNTEFSIDVPLSSITDLNILRNIMLQLTRSANPNAAASLIRRPKEWEIKLGFRYLF